MTSLNPDSPKKVGDRIVLALRDYLLKHANANAGLTVDQISQDKDSNLSRPSTYRAIKTYPYAFPRSSDSGWPQRFYCIPENLPKFDETVNAFKPKAPLKPMGTVEAYYGNQPYEIAVKSTVHRTAQDALTKATLYLKELNECRDITLKHLSGAEPIDLESIEECMAKIPAMIDTLKGIAAGLSRIEAHPLYGMPTQYLALITEGTEAP